MPGIPRETPQSPASDATQPDQPAAVDPAISSQSRLRVFVILGFCALLAVQGVLSFATRPEPYPTIRMPGFAASSIDNERFENVTTVSVTIEYEDGPTINPHPAELMDDFKPSSARPSLDHVFRVDSGASVSPEVTDWLHDRAQDLGDGNTPTHVEFCWQEVAIEIATAESVDEQPCETTRIELGTNA